MSESGRSEIILVSTRTIDRVPQPDGSYREVPGGPATYVGGALEELGYPHRLITGERAVVEVLRTAEGEQQYLLPPLPLIPLPDPLRASAVILSPIIREIDPHTLPEVEGLLALDLQGFVRDPHSPSGSASHQFDLTSLLRRADVVKAASDELPRLTPESREMLHSCLLLETRGAAGAVLYVDGKTEIVPAHRVLAPDTIGAGDTYLAAFVVGLIDGMSRRDAAESAARFTETWLCRVKGGRFVDQALARSDRSASS